MSLHILSYPYKKKTVIHKRRLEFRGSPLTSSLFTWSIHFLYWNFGKSLFIFWESTTSISDITGRVICGCSHMVLRALAPCLWNSFRSNLFTFLSLGSAHFTAFLVYNMMAFMLQSGPSVCTSNLRTSLVRTLPCEYCIQH